MGRIKLNKDQAMELALKEAQKGLGRVSPNPPVGAVVVDSEGYLLSTGYHKAYGEDHAEMVAIQNCNSSLKGATLYVTLEPCAHQGLTPSCAEKLSTLPLHKVCLGVVDPNPKVCGRGIEKLKKASIPFEVYEGIFKEKLYELIEAFSYNMKYQKPFVALKIASSLNGRISTPQRKWITNEKSREQVSYIRGCYDAVCVGAQTILQDNPRLNARHPQFENQENYVVILDPLAHCCEFLKNSLVTQVRDISKVIVVTSQSHYKNYQGPIIQMPANDRGLFDLEDLLKELFKKKVYSVLVEGGVQTFSSFMPIAQRLYLFLAPTLISSKESLSWDKNLLFNPSLLHLKDVQHTVYDKDILITGLLNG